MWWSYLTRKVDNYTKKKSGGFFQEKSKWKTGLELEEVFQQSAYKCDFVFQNVSFHSIANNQHFFMQGKKIFSFLRVMLFNCCWKMVSTAVCMHGLSTDLLTTNILVVNKNTKYFYAFLVFHI